MRRRSAGCAQGYKRLPSDETKNIRTSFLSLAFSVLLGYTHTYTKESKIIKGSPIRLSALLPGHPSMTF